MECEETRWQPVQVTEIGKTLCLSVSFNASVEYPKAPCIIDNVQLCGLPIRLQKDRQRERERGRYVLASNPPSRPTS